ncbi:MAG TPA: PfkB family carbohydrate kinase [bacterium]|nr:PfkB family carbohydrate kinase [bacterium]HOL34769.1 PfkB family carbohydrate kinase [bacterium]HPP07772.1 PfkB family carbohydrate kinase [bacterium]
MPQNSFITIGLNPCLDVNCFAKEFKTDDIIRISKKIVSAGGKAINIAKFLSKFNVDVQSVGIAGGFNGTRFKNLLKKSGISTDFIIDIEGETRENYNFFLKTVQSYDSMNLVLP